jgi:hypothetical protein
MKEWKMKWKVFGRKRPWRSFKVISQYAPGTEENHETTARIAGFRAKI